jgi:hypothetical protein
MKKEDVVNGLIAADDLHWCEEEQKYILLTMEEVDGILQACADQGMNEDQIEDVMKVVKWCESIRAGQLLWKNFVAGHIGIYGFDDKNEPMFGKYEEQSDA